MAQLLGGVLAASLAHLAHGQMAIETGLGATTFGAGVNVTQAVVAEALGAFILVTAVFALAVNPNAPKGLHGVGIGLALATQILAFGPIAGASVNLARTFGPDVVLTFAGGAPAWSQLPVYLVAPVVGGILAAGLYALLTSVSRPAHATSSH